MYEQVSRRMFSNVSLASVLAMVAASQNGVGAISISQYGGSCRRSLGFGRRHLPTAGNSRRVVRRGIELPPFVARERIGFISGYCLGAV